MAEDTDLDLKKEEMETPEPESSSKETNPKVDGDLKNEGEEKITEEKAEKLLADGTPVDKEIKVSKKTYDDKNDKAKLYETHAVLIDKIVKNPDLVEELLQIKEKGNLDDRVRKLEEERKETRRREIKEAVVGALSQWPEFEKLWPEIQPIADALVKNGVPYKDAFRRGYFALNPDAAAAEKERLAKEGINKLGTYSTSQSSQIPRDASFKEKRKLNDNERRIAKVFGKSEEEYSRLLETHSNWLRSKGFNVELE